MSSGERYSVWETIKKMGVVICCQSLLEYTQVNISSHTHWGLLFPMILLKQWSDALHDVKAWSRKRTLPRTSMSAFYLDNTAPWMVNVRIAAQIIWRRMPRLPRQIFISIFEIGADVPSFLLKSQWRTSAWPDCFTEFSTLTQANIYGRC